jgi:hypothetical protein
MRASQQLFVCKNSHFCKNNHFLQEQPLLQANAAEM